MDRCGWNNGENCEYQDYANGKTEDGACGNPHKCDCYRSCNDSLFDEEDEDDDEDDFDWDAEAELEEADNEDGYELNDDNNDDDE